MTVATHLALLRGVNVGGKNCLPMKDLAEIFAKAGCADVRTYIQSGNVLFRASRGVAEPLAAQITEQIASRFGYRIPVVLRTVGELAAAIRDNPFIKSGAPPETLHVYFLAGRPSASAVDSLDPDRSKPDAFVVYGREIYLRLPKGMARTKLSNAYFDSKLATTSTARNWRTVLKLFELMKVQQMT